VNKYENTETGVLSTSTDSPIQEIAYYIDTHFLSPSELPIPIDNAYLDEDDDDDDDDDNDKEGFEDEDEEGFEEEEDEKEGMEEEEE